MSSKSHIYIIKCFLYNQNISYCSLENCNLINEYTCLPQPGLIFFESFLLKLAITKFLIKSHQYLFSSFTPLK